MNTPNQDTGGSPEERAYETLARHTKEQLEQLGEMTRDSVGYAIDYAKLITADAGEFTSEQLENASNFLKRDLVVLQSNSERAVDYVQRNLDPSRIGNSFLALASDIITSAGEFLVSLGDRIEEPIKYTTGEITGPGILTCINCENELHFEKSGRIPPCGSCHETEFRKSY